jgi:hypothetical protein
VVDGGVHHVVDQRERHRHEVDPTSVRQRAQTRHAGARSERPRLISIHGQEATGLGSFGNPSTRSPTMLRWIWLVPPQIVSERLKKNDDCNTEAG